MLDNNNFDNNYSLRLIIGKIYRYIKVFNEIDF